MPDEVSTSTYEFPLAALIDASEWDEAVVKWAKLRSTQERALEALAVRRQELERIYERALQPDSEWQEITKVARMVDEWGRIAAEKLRPQIDALLLKLSASPASMSPELWQARRGSVEVAEAWLMLYHEFREKLLKLAAERRPTDAVLQVRPVKDEIDYAELSREHIARYPKIRAALAE